MVSCEWSGASGSENIAGACHDARWIPDDGRPRGGFLQFFNNEGNGNTSTVDALELPFAADGYNYEWTVGEAYSPATATWRHICLDEADGQSASNSMPNGNTFVNLSKGYQYEVDLEDNVVWQYSANPPKGFRYVCANPGIQALISAGHVDGTTCETVGAIDLIASEQINIAPNPSKGFFEINGLTDNASIKEIQVFDLLGNRIMNVRLESTIKISRKRIFNTIYTKKQRIWIEQSPRAY